MAKKILTDLYPQIKLSDDVAGELNRLAQDSLFILIASRRQKRSEGWLEYIGYTRNGKTVKSNQIDPTIKSVKALDAKIDKLLED